MNLRTAAAVGAAVGVFGVGSAFATFARVESMGKNTTYIMDDVSIFDNPANASLYSNYLIGGFGSYTDNNLKAGGNVDPQHPTFGGIFSLSFGDENNPDPKFTIGGLLGRTSELANKYLPKFVQVDEYNYAAVPTTVTNFDGFLGGTFSSGDAWGLHLYIAHQDGGELDSASNTYQVNGDAFASVVQLDGGLNFQVGSGTSYEVSAGIARIQYGPEHHSFFDDGNFSFLAKARAFFTLDAIDGELIPAASANFIAAPGIDDKSAQAGVGINVAMDRGFFWMGVDFVWDQFKSHDYFYDVAKKGWIYDSSNDDPDGNVVWDVRQDIGGKISFGIERNIWWDWFVIRVGGQKSILYTSCNVKSNSHGVNSDGKYPDNRYGKCKADGNFFSTNPLADGSNDDHVGFGFGINIEERLKIDVTVAEDLLFRNPFQGEGRIFSRLDATYSF
ncbi:MAG: hypothetical protein MJY85_06805 [Fibrobacter sp.]|nr:hypothetical protein [Fibrobacter sp.]